MADESAKKAVPKKAVPKKAGAKTVPAKKTGARGGSPELGQELTARERRCVMLTALGYTDAKIAKELGEPFGVISTSTATNDILNACTKLGLGRHGLVIWAMNHIEGKDLLRLSRAAARRRAQLRASGVLTPLRVQIAMLYADPVHCDKTQREIGLMLDPVLKSAQVSSHVRAMISNIGSDGSLTKLIAVLTLAPFSLRQTGNDEPEETETL